MVAKSLGGPQSVWLCGGNLLSSARPKAVAVFNASIRSLAVSTNPRGTQAAAELGPVRRVKVLDHIDAVVCHPGVEESEAGLDVAHHVAAVVEDDVRGAELIEESLQDAIVGLVTNPDGDLVLFEP